MLPKAENYELLIERFQWNIPEYYNIGVDVCDKWAVTEPTRLALTYVDLDGSAKDYTFGDLMMLSNRLANLLHSINITQGDRVSILLPQTPETAYSHIAIHKLAAISIPLFMLFGEEALEYRLNNSGTKAVITNLEGAAKIALIRHKLPSLEHVFTIDGKHENSRDMRHEMQEQRDTFTPIKTKADDPAILIYTSGTTGQPKGVLHAHRVLLGHLPGVEMSHDLFPQSGDKIWTPADWAWIGGLIDVLLPALHHGVPVVACRFKKFTAEAAFDLLQKYKIRNVFLPPTAIKMMRSAQGDWNIDLRTVVSGGETLGSELLEWGRKNFGVVINEFYGQTECNMIVSSCAALMTERPGIMGRAVPGHKLKILNNQGKFVQNGMLGNIAVHYPDPVMFLEYWNNSAGTEEKFVTNQEGKWLLTGDTGIMDSDDWIKFVGRDDDVITSSGYRIGPGEIEDCLIGHPAIKMAGVVGKKDPLRTEIVKAYILLEDRVTASAALTKEIQLWVKTRLAAHEYPREISYISALPMTTTGKIIRAELRKLDTQVVKVANATETKQVVANYL
jgi:acetyl-CoA synthetase